MRLLVVASDLGLSGGRPARPGGLQAAGRLIVHALSTHPSVSEVGVCTLREAAADAVGWTPTSGARVAPCAVDGFGGRRARFALAVARRRARYDHVMFLHVGVARLAGLLRFPSFSVWLHGIDAWRRLRRLERRAVERARPLLSVSRHTADKLVAHNPGAPAARVVPLALEPDASGAHARPPSPPSTRQPLVLCVGRMDVTERAKGFDALLDAWPLVAARVPAAGLMLVGDGDDRPRLARRAEALVAAGAGGVSFVGALEARALRAAYGAARVFALPSQKEGFGLVYLEAMRAGLPCIAAPGAAEEVLVAGETGLLPEPTATALAPALERLLTDDAYADRLGAAGQRRVATEFSLDAFRVRLAAALGSVLGA